MTLQESKCWTGNRNHLFVSSLSHKEEESHSVPFEDKINYAIILGPHYITPLNVSKLGSGEKQVCTKVSKHSSYIV